MGTRSPRPLPAFVSRQVVAARRYFLDLRPNATRPLTIVCGGEERVRGDYAVSRADFPYLCLEFVAAGRGTVLLSGRTFPLAAGSVFTYGPGIPHSIRTDPHRRLRKYYVDVVGRGAAAQFRAVPLAPGSHRTVCRPREIQAVFDLLQQCGLAGSSHSQPLCAQLFGVLITKIAELSLPSETSGLAGRTTFERFKQFLTAERQRLLSVEMAAEEFGISPAYACRLFRRYNARSPYQELLRQRMSLAADLLTHDRLRVREVAERLGFGEPSQFSRAFKRVAGVPPIAFQRRS